MRHSRYPGPSPFWSDYERAAGEIYELVRVGLAGRLFVDPTCFDRVDVYEDVRYMCDRIVVQFEGHIYGQRLRDHVETHEVEHPATWRDHWKVDHADRWYARWWVARHPPQLSKTVLSTRWENYAAYPTFKGVDLAPNEFGHAIHYVKPPKNEILRFMQTTAENFPKEDSP